MRSTTFGHGATLDSASFATSGIESVLWNCWALVREIENPFAAVKWQAVLGNESFVQKVRDRIKGLHKERREITALRQGARKIDPDEVLRKVARKHQISAKRLVA